MVESTHTRPPFSEAKPRAIARPSPDPCALRSAAPRTNGSKIRSCSWAGMPGTAIRHPDDDVAVDRFGTNRDPAGAARGLDRVLDEVRERTLDLSRVHAHERELVRDANVDDPVLLPDDLERARDEPVDRPQLELGLGRSRLEPDSSSRFETR